MVSLQWCHHDSIVAIMMQSQQQKHLYDGVIVKALSSWRHCNVFKYTQKGCKNQIVTAGRLLAVLDMRPSTMMIQFPPEMVEN